MAQESLWKCTLFTKMSGKIYKGTLNSMHTGMSCVWEITILKFQSFFVQNKLKHTSHKRFSGDFWKRLRSVWRALYANNISFKYTFIYIYIVRLMWIFQLAKIISVLKAVITFVYVRVIWNDLTVLFLSKDISLFKSAESTWEEQRHLV